MAINTTLTRVPPYHDAFTESKGYVKVLFKPGVSVQVRELNELQTQIQDQIDKFGSNIFKKNSRILGEDVQAQFNIPVIRVTDFTTDSSVISTLINTSIKVSGETTGVQATIINYKQIGINEYLLFLKYTQTGSTTGSDPTTENQTKRNFLAGESIATTSGTIVGNVAANGVGYGGVIKVPQSTFFVNGYFVRCEEQQVLFSHGPNTASTLSFDGKIILVANERIVNASQDRDLYDNALGQPNEGAPGADRLTMDLSVRLLSSSLSANGFRGSEGIVESEADYINNSNTIILADVVQGKINRIYRAQYGILGDTLASRTYDESGNYLIKPMNISFRDDSTTDVIKIDVHPGKGYVRGRVVENIATKTISINRQKPGDVNNISGSLQFSADTITGNFIEAVNISENPKGSDTAHSDASTTLTELTSTQYRLYESEGLYDASPGGGSITDINIAKADKRAGYIGSITFNGVTFHGDHYKLYVDDIQMNAGRKLSEASFIAKEGVGANYPTTSSNRFQIRSGFRRRGFSLFESNKNTRIFPLRPNIKTLDKSNSYYHKLASYNVTTNLTGAGSDTYTLSSGLTNSAASTNPDDFIVIVDGKVYPVARVSLSTTTACTLVLSSALPGSITQNTLYYKQKVSMGISGNHRTKTETSITGETLSTIPTTTFSTYGDSAVLAQEDVYKITKVAHSTAGLDTTVGGTYDSPLGLKLDEFVLDRNETENFIGKGIITYVGQKTLPTTGSFTVDYKYYAHDSNVGAPATVASYTTFEDIPFFNGRKLSDFADFRVKESEFRSASNIAPSGGGSDTNRKLGFHPTGHIDATITHLLPRTDVLCLTEDGDIIIKEGKPSERVLPPIIPQEVLPLYSVYLAPTNLNDQDIKFKPLYNTRYTMREIGEIDKRVKNLEYYTSMSLIEKDANEKQIFDANGIRFKNGIFTDGFLNHSKANFSEFGYRASIDPRNNTLRPSFRSQTLQAFVSGGYTPADSGNGISASENVSETALRLPAIARHTLISQEYASVAVSVNPYDVATFRGHIELSPSSDEWKEVERKEDVIIQMTQNFSHLQGMVNDINATGTVWGEWDITWNPPVQTVTRTEVFDEQQNFGFDNNFFANESQLIGHDITTTLSQTGSAMRQGIKEHARLVENITSDRDRVVSSETVPFMRQRYVYFYAQGLRPNTVLQAYLDEVNITDHTRKVTSSVYATKQYTKGQNNIVMGPASNLGNVTKATITAGTTSLKTDSAGEIHGFFLIPPNKFRTGVKTFTLMDAFTFNSTSATTIASAEYAAVGILETKQREIITGFHVEKTRDVVNEQDQVNRITRQNTVFEQLQQPPVTYEDPIAQSFLLPDNGLYKDGVYASDVELFFANAPTDNIPVRIQLVTVENGVPTQKIVPNSMVYKDASTIRSKISSDASVPTKFKFKAPVHLSYGVEYAIVVISNSAQYSIWHSEVGGDDKSGKGRIDKNPYLGVSFKSQNASTWTPDQNKDFKFNISHYEFQTNVNKNFNLSIDWPEKVLGSGTNIAAQETAVFRINSTSVEHSKTNIVYNVQAGGTGTANTYSNVMVGEEVTLNESVSLSADGTYGSVGTNAAGLQVTLTTSNKFVTPIVNLDRLSVTMYNIIINSVDDIIDSNADTEEQATGLPGNALARYVTKRVKLNDPSTRLDVFVGVSIPEGSEVRAYVRPNHASQTENVNTKKLPFIRMRQFTPPAMSTKKFSEAHFVFDTQAELMELDSSVITNYSTQNSSPNFLVASNKSVETFDEFTVKIVMLAAEFPAAHSRAGATDTSKYPRLKDFRAIATV